MSGYYSAKWIYFNHTSDGNMSNMQTKPRPIEEIILLLITPLPPVADIGGSFGMISSMVSTTKY